MIDSVISSTSFVILLSLFTVGSLGSLLLSKRDSYANAWSSFFAILGSLWGMIFAVSIIISGHSLSFLADESIFSLFSISFKVDPLSAFFVFVISLISFFCSRSEEHTSEL